MFTGCIVLIKSDGRDRLLGKFTSEAHFESLVETAKEKKGVLALQVCGLVNGREVNREFSPREAAQLSR